MASPNNPRSSADILREHSHANMHTVSKKVFFCGIDPLTGKPKMSRELTDEDAIEMVVKKWG